MSKKTNGSGKNGDDKENIVSFPSFAERQKKLREEKQKQDAWRKAYAQKRKAQQQVPFINLHKIPRATSYFMGLIIFIHVCFHLFMDMDMQVQILYYFAFNPAQYRLSLGFYPHILWTPITYNFLHSSWMHLFFNSIMAMTIGLFFEKQQGTKRTIIYFLLSGIGGVAFHFLLNPFEYAIIIGSSAGLSGIFGGALFELQRMLEMRTGQKRNVIPLIAFWIILMVGLGSLGGNVAWQAHLGGFFTGLLLYALIRKKIIRI